MLLELKVSNFAIIDNLHVQFKEGLNILSGETGSGKSVLLKSLGLLMGQKGSNEQIRSGHQVASIEGYFDIAKRQDIQNALQAMGIESDDGMLVVRRTLGVGDKSRVYLNGVLSTLANLREVVSPLIEVAGHSAPLIEMTGQHENRHLLSKAYHLDLLDQYAGIWEVRHLYSEKFTQLHSLQNKISELRDQASQKAQRLDFLIFQRDEIAAFDLNPNEDQELEIEVKKLKNMSRLSQFVDTAEAALYSDDDSALSRIHAVMHKASELSSVDPTLTAKLDSLAQAKSLIEDSIYDLRNYVAKIDGDPTQLEKLEQRLSDFRKIQKKYGSSAQEILSHLVQVETEIGELQNSESMIEELSSKAAQIEKDLQKIALDMHKRRSEAAILLAAGVNDELLDLNMKGVTFHVEINKLEILTSTGITDVEYMSQTSPKDPKRALAKFASGGELSRILLSLKRVIGATNQPRTYLFDEVDTGVSGNTAEKVGRKLHSIAQGQQVICVTHLPQVAAYGDHHFVIQKSPVESGAAMEVVEVKKKDRVKEIARLISGEKISKTSLAHAEELLKEAQA